ncbi:MAG: hypothetical protein AAGJ84_00010 [Pseudomonadota bacterium]
MTFDPYKEGSPDDFAGSPTWALTLAILVGLLLIGFFTGFVTRGAAIAAVPTERAQDYLLTVRSLESVRTDLGQNQQSMTIGSSASDQILSLTDRGDEGFEAVVKLHSNSPDQPDELSVIKILRDGTFKETLRRPGTGQSEIVAVSAASGGAYVAYPTTNAIAFSRLDDEGNEVWTKSLLAQSSNAIGARIYEHGEGIILFAPGHSTGEVRVASIDALGSLKWELPLEASKTASMTIGESGEIFVLSQTANKGSAKLTAVTPSGSTAWTSTLFLEQDEKVAGLAVTSTGGLVAVLYSRQELTLLEYDVVGQLVQTANVDGIAKQNSALSVSAVNDGSILVYGLSDEQFGWRDLALFQLKSDGHPVGHSTIKLMASATLDHVTVSESGDVLVAGSVRPDRYSGTDIFLNRLNLDFAPDAMREREPMSVVMADSADSLEKEPSFQQVAFEPSAPLGTGESFPSLVASNPLENPPVALPSIDQVQMPRARLTRFASGRWQDRETEAIASTAQCRFTCTDSAESQTTFPIWRSIKLQDGQPLTSLDNQHDLICQSAGGQRSSESAPDCAD